MRKINKRLFITIAIVGLFILSIIYIFSSVQKRDVEIIGDLKIISSNPTHESSGFNVFDPITLTFNQNVDASFVDVLSDPPEDWSILQTSEDSVELRHKLYLRMATTYKLAVSYDGKAVGELIFETAKDQNDPRMLQSLQSELDKDYPLASLTPYETPNYRVVYSAPLTLEISIKSQISAEDSISQIKSWVKQNGADPSTHKYTTIINTNQ